MMRIPVMLAHSLCVILIGALLAPSPAWALRQPTPAEQDTGLEELQAAVTGQPSPAPRSGLEENERRLAEMSRLIHDVGNRIDVIRGFLGILELDQGLVGAPAFTALQANFEAAHRQFAVSRKASGRARLAKDPANALVGARDVARDLRAALAILDRDLAQLGEPVVRAAATEPEEALRDLERVREAWTGSGQLTDRIEQALAGTPQHTVALVDLAAVIRRYVPVWEGERLVIGSPMARIARIEVALPPSPVWIQADPFDLERVLYNLVSNAGWEFLRNDRRNGQVWITVRAAGSEVEVTVRDDGAGLPADVLDLLTSGSPVTQFPSREGASAAGLHGIGLTVVRDTVAQWGGRLQGRNPPDGGAEIIIRLPLASPAAGLEEPTQAVAPAPGVEQRLRQVRGVVHDLNNRANSVLIPLSGLASRLNADHPAARQFSASAQHVREVLDRFRRPYEEAMTAHQADAAIALGAALLKDFGEIFGELNVFLGGYPDGEILAGRLSDVSEEWLGTGLRNLRASVGRAATFAQEQQAALRAAGAPPEEVVDLAQMLPAQRTWLVAEAQAHGNVTDVQIQVRGEALRVRLVPGHLVSALHNLIVDASQALRRAQRGNGVVHILASRELRDGRALIVLEVRDNGPGLPPAVISTMNAPEVVARFPSESEGAEHGLGLAGVKREVIEQWRGQIQAGNLSDGGARFTITLPLAEAEQGSHVATGLEELTRMDVVRQIEFVLESPVRRNPQFPATSTIEWISSVPSTELTALFERHKDLVDQPVVDRLLAVAVDTTQTGTGRRARAAALIHSMVQAGVPAVLEPSVLLRLFTGLDDLYLNRRIEAYNAGQLPYAQMWNDGEFLGMALPFWILRDAIRQQPALGLDLPLDAWAEEHREAVQKFVHGFHRPPAAGGATADLLSNFDTFESEFHRADIAFADLQRTMRASQHRAVVERQAREVVDRAIREWAAAPSATPGQPVTVIAVGPSIYTQNAEINALLERATAQQFQKLVRIGDYTVGQLRNLHSSPWRLDIYAASGDRAADTFETSAQAAGIAVTRHPTDGRDLTPEQLLELLREISQGLMGQPLVPERLTELRRALEVLAFMV